MRKNKNRATQACAKSRTKKKSDGHKCSIGGAEASSSLSLSTNKPKNHLIKDASSPYTFQVRRYGQTTSITVRQTPEDDTWPGGALWDVGVLMAQLLVGIQCSPASASVPKRLFEHPGLWWHWKDKRILELGCGVGLTGLIAASLGARAVLLTDLDAVVERVTKPNIEMNSAVLGGFRAGSMGTGTKGKAGGQTGGVNRVAALPLCWGAQTTREQRRRPWMLWRHHSSLNATGQRNVEQNAGRKVDHWDRTRPITNRRSI